MDRTLVEVVSGDEGHGGVEDHDEEKLTDQRAKKQRVMAAQPEERSMRSRKRHILTVSRDSDPPDARGGKQNNLSRSQQLIASSSTYLDQEDFVKLLEESTQLPTIEGNDVLVPLSSNLNEILTCKLCSGYFKSPYTINECLHT